MMRARIIIRARNFNVKPLRDDVGTVERLFHEKCTDYHPRPQFQCKTIA
jgi:hypothetical protein